MGFPQLVEIAGGESPGHTAVEHDLEYFRLQETDLVCHCDVWVVVHRPAVLEEAVPGVASPAFDLRANVPNAADGAAKIHEGVDLAVPLPRGLHGNRFCLHGGGTHVCTNELIVLHLLVIFICIYFYFLVNKNPSYRNSNSRPNVSEGYEVTN